MAGGAAYLYAMGCYLKAKGRSLAWLLLGAFTLLVAPYLKDYCKDGVAPAGRSGWASDI
jgi:hypothetical protein